MSIKGAGILIGSRNSCQTENQYSDSIYPSIILLVLNTLNRQ